MFGFLLKFIVVVLLVGGIFTFAYPRISGQTDKISTVSSLVGQVRSLDFKSVSQGFSSQLDQLITHTDRSPVVMGIDITNQSLEAMVDSLRSLPPAEMEMVRQLICQPASASAQN